MPSNIDKAFIKNLQNFTDSLEGIVKLLEQQAKKGDAINQMLSTIDGPSMSNIAEDIKTLVEKTDKIDTTTQKILEEIKASRKSNESGTFGEVSDTKNKNKIVDGIGVIILIAAGVLAIGMAFKIIGKIDVMSVLALGIAIYAVSKAFAEIAKIKELTPTTAILAGLVMITIAGALVASSYILKYMESIDIFTAFSMILVGGALGIAALLLLKSVAKLKLTKKTIAAILLLPVILPLIAAAIVGSSFIIKYMEPIDLKTGISFALLGAALGISAFLLLKSVSKMDLTGKALINILLLPVILPIIAAAIVGSSFILQHFKPLKTDPLIFIGHSLSMGLGIVAFLPVFYIIGKLKMTNPVQLLMGGLAVLIVSTAIMISSWILSVGNYDKYPSAKWALGAGLSMILFTPSLILFGILAMSGIGLIALALGAVGALITATTIVAVSHVLGLGNYEGGPSLGWALGVGFLLPIFGVSMVAVALIPFGKTLLNRGGEMILTVASTIAAVSYILKLGSYSGGPTKDWAEGVGLSLGAFASALDVAIGNSGGFFGGDEISTEDFIKFISSVSHGMVAASEILAKGNWDVNGPSKAWGEGVGAGLQPFIDIFGMLSTSPKAKSIMKDLIKSKGSGDENVFTYFMKEVAKSMVSVNNIFSDINWSGYPTKDWSNGVKQAFDVISVIGSTDDSIIEGIDNFADAIKNLSKSFDGLKSSGIDKFGKLTASVTILSAVDQKQLNNIIGVLDNNKEKLANVSSEIGKSSNPSSLKNITEKITNKFTESNNSNLSPDGKVLSDKFDEVLEKFDEVLENMVKSGQGKDAGSTDKVGA